jgi:putative membrane protein
MNWWCTATRAPWDWSWKAYPGVWLLWGSLLTAYLLTVRRRTRTNGPDPEQRRKTVFFLLGIAVMWGITDWPLGLLGAGYLASAHMLMFMLATQAAAALLLLGLPEWMARRLFSRLRLVRVMRVLSKPLIAGVLFNVVLIGTQAPSVLDNLRANALGSWAMDMVWLLAGMIMWLPLLSPLPELRMRSYPGRMVYLFLAAGALPLIPGGFLTFADFPLYSTYELAPRVWEGFSAVDDQQLAGAIMKVGSLPVVWPVIFGLFLKWGLSQVAADNADRVARRRPAAVPGGAATPPAEPSPTA